MYLFGKLKSEKNLTGGTLTFIAIWVINALSPVQTWSTGTVINIDLANWPRETLKEPKSKIKKLSLLSFFTMK